MTFSFDAIHTSLDEPLLIEASAGTGKTYSLMHLILRILVEKRVPVTKILVVTFTRNATSELKARLRARLFEVFELLTSIKDDRSAVSRIADPTLRDQIALWIKNKDDEAFDEIKDLIENALVNVDDASIFTIHSFCQKMLQDYAFSSKNSFSFEIEDRDDLTVQATDTAVRRVSKSLPHEERLAFLGNPDFLTFLNHATSLTKTRPVANQVRFWPNETDEDTAQDDSPLTKAFGSFLQEAQKELEILKDKNRIISFNDILVKMEMKVQDPDFRKAVSDAFDAVLIDEFQDTDAIQYSIFRTLFLENAKEGRPVIFVGDPKQSIYSFRSADIDTYFQARQRIGNTGELTRNFRSTPGLVEVINSIFKSYSFLNPNLGYSNISFSDGKLPLLRKTPEGALIPVTPFEFWQIEGSGPLLLDLAHHLEDELIAEDIAKLLSSEVYVGSLKRRLAPSDIAVLVRKRYDAKGIVEELAKRNIRCIFKEREDILGSDEAVEILFILKAMENPKSRTALTAARSTHIIGERLKSVLSDQTAALKLRIALDKANQIFFSRGILSAFTALFSDFDVENRLLRQRNGERRLTNYRHVLDLLHEKNRKLKTISGLVRWLETEPVSKSDAREPRRESDADLVRIETIHNSKGLEYPVVYTPRVVPYESNRRNIRRILKGKDSNGENLYTYLTKDPDKETQKLMFAPEVQKAHEEEVRLLYVALTRASCRLVVPLFYRRKKPAKDNLPNFYVNHQNAAILHALLGANPNYKELNKRLMQDLPTAFNKLNPSVQAALRKGLGGSDFAGLVSDDDIDRFEIADFKYVPLAGLNSMTTIAISKNDHLSAAKAAFRKSDWWQTSFTGLVRNIPFTKEAPALDEDLSGEENGEDRPEETTPAPAEQEEDLLRFKKPGISAAAYGDFLHKLLERTNFSYATDFEANRADMQRHVKNELIRFGIEKEGDPSIDDHAQALTTMLGHVLRTKAFKDMPNFRLCDLPQGNRMPEMDFLISTRKPAKGREPLTAKRLGSMLERLNPSYKGLNLSDADMTGFLTGSIDLAFLTDGKFWIIDWKSNFLSPNLSDYQGKFLDQAMDKKHYKLQYLLYTVALKRFLEVRTGIKDGYKIIGGCAYFFLRGVNENNPFRGIFFDRPDPAVIACLDDALLNGYSEAAVNRYIAQLKGDSE